jgi:hypothetical protein
MIESVKLCSSEPRELAALIAERHELLRLLTQVKIGVIVLTTMMAGFILLLSWNFAAGSIEFWPFVLLTACVFSASMVYIRQIRLLGLYPQRGVDRVGHFRLSRSRASRLKELSCLTPRPESSDNASRHARLKSRGCCGRVTMRPLDPNRALAG